MFLDTLLPFFIFFIFFNIQLGHHRNSCCTELENGFLLNLTFKYDAIISPLKRDWLGDGVAVFDTFPVSLNQRHHLRINWRFFRLLRNEWIDVVLKHRPTSSQTPFLNIPTAPLTPEVGSHDLESGRLKSLM